MKMKRVISIGMIMLCACMPIQSSAAQMKGYAATTGGSASASANAYFNSNAPMECTMSADIRVTEGINNSKSTAKYTFYLLGTNCAAIGSSNYYVGKKWHTDKNGKASSPVTVVNSNFSVARTKNMYSKNVSAYIYDGVGKPYASVEVGW